jgi:hypothetical protein
MIYRKILLITLSVFLILTIPITKNVEEGNGGHFKVSFATVTESGDHGLEVEYLAYTDTANMKMLALYGDAPKNKDSLLIVYDKYNLRPTFVGDRFIVTTKFLENTDEILINYKNSKLRKIQNTIKIPIGLDPLLRNISADTDPGYVLADVDSKGRGATWNTCEPIKYKINLKNAPAGAEEFVKTTMTEVQKQTGIEMKYSGYTKRTPWKRIKGKNAAEDVQTISIMWHGSETFIPGRDDLTLGMALSGRFNVKGRLVIQSGIIVFHTKYFNKNTTITNYDKEVFLHELGHIFNLTHTAHEDQVMYPAIPNKGYDNKQSYQDKDLIGINKVKRKKC